MEKNLIVQRALPPYYENGLTRFNIRHKPGVYLIYKHKRLVYVGYSASDVYKTMYRHFQKWNDKSQQRVVYQHLNNITVRVVYCRTGAKAKALEEALILKYKPEDNINKYERFEMDSKNKEALKEYEDSSKNGIYIFKEDLPF